MRQATMNVQKRAERRDPFAFESAPDAPEQPKAHEPADEPVRALDLSEDLQAVYATRLTPEAIERLPEEMKAAIRAREAKAKRLTEAYTVGYRRRAIIAICAGGVLSVCFSILMPIQQAFMFILLFVQGALGGYLIVRNEATPFGSVWMYGGGNVAVSLVGFIAGWISWRGAPGAFFAWLFSFGIGMGIAMWARRDRERFNSF